MTETPPTRRLLRADETAEANLRPLFRDARLLRRGVVSEIREVDDVLAEARERAKHLVDEATTAADSIREAAAAEGYREGLRSYLEQLARLETLEASVRQRAADDALTLAFRTAERLVGRAIDRNDTAFADLVASCLGAVGDAPRIVLRVHPSNVQRLSASPGPILSVVGDVPVAVEADSTLDVVDCIIDTARGQIDARLQVRLDALLQALRGPE